MLAPGVASAYDLARDDYSPDAMPFSYVALMQMKPMDVMHQMDKGNTGNVTMAEFMKSMEAMFGRMDQNKDGKVSADEWLMKVWKGQ